MLKKNYDKKYMIFVGCVILLSAVVAITFCSKASPLYRFHDWTDPHCFFTVAKSMNGGQVLYRDVFEQKGPLLYMVHIPAVWISRTTFLGVYLMELLLAVIYLFYAYKLLRLFCDKNVVLMLPLLAGFTYSAYAYQGGDSAEELLMPLGVYCLYLGLTAIKGDGLLTLRQKLLVGAAMGVVLWMKFTLLGPYIGFVLAFVIIYIRKKRYADILYTAVLMIGGILLVSLPVLFYFARHNAFDALYEVYFYDNIFLYDDNGMSIPVMSKVINMIIGIYYILRNDYFAFFAILFGFLFLAVKKEKKSLLLYACMYLGTLMFVYFGARFFDYYPFMFNIFAPMGMAGIYSFLKYLLKPESKEKRRIMAAVSFSLAPIGIIFSPCLPKLLNTDSDYPQIRFAKIMNQKENPTLLNYRFLDGGFYTAADIEPNCRFFCELVVPNEDMYRVQDDFVLEGKTDFVVTQDIELSSPKYECVDWCAYTYRDNANIYYLYARKDLS